jgi:hypothetical protein
MTSFVLISMQRAIAHWYYVEIFCTELHSDMFRNVEHTGGILCLSLTLV